MTNQIPNKIYPSEDEMPAQYYNLRSDMKIKPAPLLNPATLQPVTKDELTPVFCQEMVEQELDDTTRFFDIPRVSHENLRCRCHSISFGKICCRRRILSQHPGTTGSLGCAISEAVEAAVSTRGYRYVLGSVLNQVLLHQSIIGLEAKAALEKYQIKPDTIIGCAGGGSNLGGLIAPFMGEKLRGENDYRIIAAEPASFPSLTRGRYAYDFCDTGMVCPMAKMYTLGHDFISSANHAIRCAIDEAVKARETGEKKTILFGLSGTGYFDLTAYQQFNDGTMTDFIPSDEDLKPGFDSLPEI